MKTAIIPSKVKATVTIFLIVVSSFLLSFSLVNYFVFDKEVSAIALIISAIIFGKSMMSMWTIQKNKMVFQSAIINKSIRNGKNK